MADDWERMYVLPLDGTGVDPAVGGGKGATLAGLTGAGLPVPPGFLVTAGAYRRYLEHHGLDGRVLAAAAEDPPEQAERAISELFSEHDLPTQIAGPIRWAYADTGDRYHAVAVRPSGTAVDLPDPGLGERQDTYLQVEGEADLLEAVRRCWRSLWSAQAIAYRDRHGLPHADAALAVVVQNMVDSHASGLMYTSGPVNGAADQVVVSASLGLGGAVVGGRVDPDTLVLDKGSGAIITQSVADKAERTAADGTVEPVPPELRARPALSPAEAAELARLGDRAERWCGRPMVVEWAWRDGPHILQARPLTGEGRPELGPPATGDARGDALGRGVPEGDHLWTRAGLGEAVPDVLTPVSLSLVERMLDAALPGGPAYAEIGGRLYLNLGQAAAFARRGTLEQVYGELPPDVALPRERPSASRIPAAARSLLDRRRLPDYLAASPGRCAALRHRIGQARYPEELTRLWRDALGSLFTEAGHMLAAAPVGPAGVRAELAGLAGPDDADAMLSGLRVPDGGEPAARSAIREAELAAMGPVVGLARLAHGTLDRSSYLREWGHRGAHEFEVAMPRPAEDPGWIDRQLMALGEAGLDAAALRARRREESREAWGRFRARYPAKVTATRRAVGRWARAAHLRESALSEAARAFWVLRAFVLRAGEMTGHGSDLYFLDIDEIVGVLRGREEALAEVPARRRAHQRCRTLPACPALVRGPFDPFAWSADPGRRTDYAGPGGAPPGGDAVAGASGASGTAEGRVRVLHSPEEGDTLRPGEILVAPVTNVGWTPLFPRAAALVTDVGAPLSHAAGVARELGLPAVVGTGDATMRLRTGDRVRVDGAAGTVRVVRSADRLPTTAG
ncbi:PEP/pyruvate-binding domain-containing protein [Spirillospora sp. NPDC050679]